MRIATVNLCHLYARYLVIVKTIMQFTGLEATIMITTLDIACYLEAYKFGFMKDED